MTHHETKKAAAKAALVTTDVMNTLIRRAQMAGVRVTERSATGFRFAVPTYMERLIITNIRDKEPRQLMLEAFFSPANARTPQIMPPPAALALMRPGFLEHVKSVLNSTLPPDFLPGLSSFVPVKAVEGLTPFVPVKATECVDTEDEPPARAEDVDSVMEAMAAQMKERELEEQRSAVAVPEAAVPEGGERSESLPEAGVPEAAIPEVKKPDNK